MKVLKIVLTGGPRAGKTSIIPKMKEYLESLPNAHVFVIPETATELFKFGMEISNDKQKALVFQDIVYTFQKAKEDAMKKYMENLSDDANVFIIYDRGIMDNRAYLEDNEFDDILKKYNDNELSILSNYDVVFGLCSSSKIKGQYEKGSNEARYEDECEAKFRDARTIESWSLHQNFKIIDATDKFEDKINIVMDELKSICNNQEKRTYKRYMFECPFNLKVLEQYNAKKTKSIDYYINYYFKDAVFVAEKRMYKDASAYNVKVKKINSDEEITIKNQNLSYDEFNEILNYNRIDKILYKTTYIFIKDNQVWNLYLIGGKYFLEVETSLQHPNVELPKELDNAIEISNEVYYDQIANLGFNRTLNL